LGQALKTFTSPSSVRAGFHDFDGVVFPAHLDLEDQTLHLVTVKGYAVFGFCCRNIFLARLFTEAFWFHL
jgi:hypothetical protein